MYENSIQRFFLVLIISIILAGCGVKAPPAIPRQTMAPEVSNLQYELEDNILTLHWTIPETEDECKNR